MSKRRTFLRRTALSFAAGAGVCAAADVATAQIVLNGGTHNAHSAITDGGLNSRYWTEVPFAGNFQAGPTPFAGANNLVPFRTLNTAMSFINGTDGGGVPEQLGPGVAQTLLVQGIDFPITTTAGGDPVNSEPNTAEGGGNPFIGVAIVSPDNHMAAWTGVFNATEAGLHDFWTQSDDASMIFIDGQKVVDNNHQQGIAGSKRPTPNAPVNLTPGNHDIVILFQESGGDSGVYITWKSPSGVEALIDPAASPTNFKSYAAVDSSTQTVTVTANSTIDVRASKASFGDLTLTNSTLALTGIRHAERTTFGATTATGASGVNAAIDASLASLNAGGGGLTTFTKTGPAGLRIDGTSTLTNATTVAVAEGVLALNATGGATPLGAANISLAGGVLGLTNTDTTAATLANVVTVPGNGTINVGGGGGVNLTSLNLTAGATLTKGGGGTLTPTSVNVPGGGAVTFAVQGGLLATPAYNSGGAALTVNKTDGGELRLTTIGTPLAAGGSFNVQAGVLAVTNNAVGTTIGTTPVNLSGGRLRIDSTAGVVSSVEGLRLAYISNNGFDVDRPGIAPPNGLAPIQTRIIHSEVNNDARFDNPNNPQTPWIWEFETWVYSGQIFDADGVFSFGEHIDDNTLVRINGQQVLLNQAWDVPTGATFTGTDPDGDNWYDIEIRLGDGIFGGGPSGGGNPQTGWAADYGFGFSPNSTGGSNDGSQYQKLVEPDGGGATLLRVPVRAATNYTAAPIAVSANSSIEVTGVSGDVQLGTVSVSNGAQLDVVGGTKVSIQNLAIANGTTSLVNSSLPAATPLTVQNVQATNAQLNVGGTMNFTGAITGGKVAVAGGTANIQSTASFAGTPSLEVTGFGKMNFDAGGGTINASLVTGNTTNEGTFRFQTGTTNLGGAHLVGKAVPPTGPSVPGLLVGQIDANMDLNGNPATQFLPNPGTANPAVAAFAGVQQSIIHGNSHDTPEWEGDDETWVYTGQIFDADGVFSFAENIDDDVLIRIDGETILRDAGWNTPMHAVVNTTPGWHDIDIRLGERGGGAGAVNEDNTGWREMGVGTPPDPDDYGFGFSPDAEKWADGREYVKPVEDPAPGAQLFRTGSAPYIGKLQVDAGATASLGSFRDHFSALVAGRLNMTPNGTNAGTSSVDQLGIPGTGVMDLADNDLVVRSTAADKVAEKAGVQAEIVSAQNGLDAALITKWDGPGLTSSTARAGNVVAGFDLTGLGVIINSDLDVTTGIPGSSYTTFGGLAVTPDDILVKYTYVGDANLSGAVSFDDYVGMDNAFFELIPNLGWATGDINFDGVINFDDYSKVDQAFFFQGAPLSGEGGVAAVPEPATWIMVVLGSLAGLFTWFRRKT